MLSYMDIHFRYTLTAVGVLATITRPFISRSEVFKMASISVMAVLYTTPWDNFIIYSGTWSYPPDRILAFVGYTPVEEYMFFVVQTVLTVLWTLLCVRWSTPCMHFNYDRRSYLLIRWIPISMLGAAAIVGYAITIQGRPTFYLGCILWWVCPVLMFLWYGAGNFFIKNIVPSTVAVVVPTLYLCWLDQIALKENVWHITETTSLNVFVAEDLPLEEALFFSVSNLLIVLAANAFDKSHGMMDTYTTRFPLRCGCPFSLRFVGQLFWAFATPEYTMASIVTEDIKTCMETVRTSSKSIYAASNFFQSGTRLDLIILYAFRRVTYDMIADESDAEKKQRKYGVIEAFVGELFADRKSDRDVMTGPGAANIDWSRYRPELTDREMAIFRAASRTAFYLPRWPFDDLLAGYRWDVEGRPVRDEDDLMLYSSYVAGSVGAMCGHVLMYRSDDKHGPVGLQLVVEKARQIGRVLQLMNIARNIVTDSETLGRCYVPTEYMDDEEEEMRILCANKKPRSLGDKKLIKYSTKIIKFATRHQTGSLSAIECLPYETRGPVLATVEIGHRVFSDVQSDPMIYLNGAPLSKWNLIVIGLYALYVKSIQCVV